MDRKRQDIERRALVSQLLQRVLSQSNGGGRGQQGLATTGRAENHRAFYVWQLIRPCHFLTALAGGWFFIECGLFWRDQVAGRLMRGFLLITFACARRGWRFACFLKHPRGNGNGTGRDHRAVAMPLRAI